MCGICGIYAYAVGELPDERVLRSMTTTMAHRGPDDHGILLDGAIALGHRRLSIIDPAAGHQPLANEDQTIWTVVNGEIYNFRELRKDLADRGHRFRTRSDSEVIVHAYEEYGVDCVTRLNGMFALAIWDRCRRRLLLARDAFGIKPLYVWDQGGSLRFASELKAFLVDPAFPRTIDPIALDQYLTFQFVPSPRTLFTAVQKIRPGHRAIVEPSGWRVERFVDDVPEITAPTSQDEAVRELQDLLVDAVQRQMVSDVPLGALLSGGVDSATVVAIMRELLGRRVKTFTVGFDGSFAGNELSSARRSADILGTEHHDVTLTANACADLIDTAAWHLDEPVATPSALPMYALSRLAAGHVKVVLTGQGVDEPWAGYPRYRGERAAQWYRRIPGPVRSGVIAPLTSRVGRAEKLTRAVHALGVEDAARRFARVYTVFTPEMKRRLYRPELAALSSESHDADAVRYWQVPVSHLDPLAQQLFVETRLSLADNLLLYGDKMSMAAGLEARVPMLDPLLMRFVERLPSRLRLKGWSQHKYLYRKAIRRWLPDEILNRPKIGFSTPVNQWLRGPLAGLLRERLCHSRSALAPYFESSYVSDLVQQHVSGAADRTRPLFALLMFESWQRQFSDESFPRADTKPVPAPAAAHAVARPR